MTAGTCPAEVAASASAVLSLSEVTTILELGLACSRDSVAEAETLLSTWIMDLAQASAPPERPQRPPKDVQIALQGLDRLRQRLEDITQMVIATRRAGQDHLLQLTRESLAEAVKLGEIRALIWEHSPLPPAVDWDGSSGIAKGHPLQTSFDADPLF